MSMSVDVSVRDQDGEVLPASTPGKPLLQTQAYTQQLNDADALIRKIVDRNLAHRG